MGFTVLTLNVWGLWLVSKRREERIRSAKKHNPTPRGLPWLLTASVAVLMQAAGRVPVEMHSGKHQKHSRDAQPLFCTHIY